MSRRFSLVAADLGLEGILEGEEDEDGGGDDAAATLLNEANDLYMVELREAVQQGVDGVREALASTGDGMIGAIGALLEMKTPSVDMVKDTVKICQGLVLEEMEPKLLAIGQEIDQSILHTQRRLTEKCEELGVETEKEDPMQAARDDDVARADTAFSENIKHVYEEFYVSTCYDKNVKNLKKIKREAGNTRATALQNNDHASLAVISTEEETLTKAIKMEEENAKDSAGCAIYAASRAMGLTSVPARDAKASKAAIERIVALDLGRPTAAVNPLAATEIKEAIKQYVLADIANNVATP